MKLRESFGVLSAAVIAAVTSGCTTTFTPVFNQTDLSTVDFSKVDEMRQGESCQKRFLLFFGPFGSQSLVKAVKDGAISKVSVVDYAYRPGFFIQSWCIVAYGK
jgi:hypothetical protein